MKKIKLEISVIPLVIFIIALSILLLYGFLDSYNDGHRRGYNQCIGNKRCISLEEDLEDCKLGWENTLETLEDVKEDKMCFMSGEEQIETCKVFQRMGVLDEDCKDKQYKVRCRFTFYDMGEWKTTIEEIISNDISCGDYDWATIEILDYETICY